jgi:flagellar biosynthesis chaperone FliJ
MSRTEATPLFVKRSNDRQDDDVGYSGRDTTIAFTSESLRPKASESVRAEDKISVFWRVFGGTILSITALVVIQAYQSVSANVQDLRNDQTRIREQAVDFVKKDEFSSRTTSLWNRVQELQNLNTAISVTGNKLSGFEQQLANAERDRKEMQAALAALHALREKDAALEKQLRDAEMERKEFTRELQLLRERLAKLEGSQASPKPAKE